MKFKFLLVFLIMLNLKNTLLANETVNLYDFSFEDIDGNQVNLEKFAGKPILIVNTASRCGFTPQYEDLQNLFLNYRKMADYQIFRSPIRLVCHLRHALEE